MIKPSSLSDSLFVVGVGAAAGGREALVELFLHTPSNEHVCYLVVCIGPDASDAVTDLVEPSLRLPVERAVDGTPLAGGTIYVAEPSFALRCEGAHLRVVERPPQGALDLLFNSLAATRGPRCAAVVLSGAGTDGCAGARLVSTAGGLVLAQLPSTAAFDELPWSVIASELVELTLPPAAMGAVLGEQGTPVANRARPAARASGRRLAPELPPAPTNHSPLGAQGALERELFPRLARDLLPPFIVFGSEYALLFQSGGAERYLIFPDGIASLDVRQLLHRDAGVLLEMAVERLEGDPSRDVVCRAVPLRTVDGESTATDLRIRQLPALGGGTAHVVLFEEPGALPRTAELPTLTPEARERLGSLQRELALTRRELETTATRLAAMSPAVARTATALLTSHRELQDDHERLVTAHAELHARASEIERRNADLDDIFAAVEAGLLVLDQDLVIRRFNDRATQFVRVAARDVGRSFGDLNHSFAGAPLLDDCARALRQQEPGERLLFTDEGARVLFRVKPLGDPTQVLVTFSDVTGVELLEETTLHLGQAIDQLDTPVVLLDTAGIITYANRCFGETSRRDAAYLPGTDFADLVAPDSRAIHEEALRTTSRGTAWHGVYALDIPGHSCLPEEVRLRPLTSDADRVIGVARFSVPIR